MMLFDANRELFRKIEFRGSPALYTVLYIDRKTLPDGIERYEIRHSERDDRCPVQIARSIFSNHFGTILTNEPLQLTPDGVRRVDDILQRDNIATAGAFRRQRIKIIINSDKPHTKIRKNAFQIISGLEIVPAKSGQILYHDAVDFTSNCF